MQYCRPEALTWGPCRNDWECRPGDTIRCELPESCEETSESATCVVGSDGAPGFGVTTRCGETE
ncbi:MAG: hypothetical protein H6713_31550 [Myxococcales bacterium]|nr:hypothetical protein [Myxococcales bacterium]